MGRFSWILTRAGKGKHFTLSAFEVVRARGGHLGLCRESASGCSVLRVGKGNAEPGASELPLSHRVDQPWNCPIMGIPATWDSPRQSFKPF